MSKRNSIVLTEEDLHFIVEESVKQYMINEGVWGGIQNMYNGYKNRNFNFAQQYQTGKVAGDFQKGYNIAYKGIQKMIAAANRVNNKDIEAALSNITDQMKTANDNFQAMAQKTSDKRGIEWDVATPDAWRQQQQPGGGSQPQRQPGGGNGTQRRYGASSTT